MCVQGAWLWTAIAGRVGRSLQCYQAKLHFLRSPIAPLIVWLVPKPKCYEVFSTVNLCCENYGTAMLTY